MRGLGGLRTSRLALVGILAIAFTACGGGAGGQGGSEAPSSDETVTVKLGIQGNFPPHNLALLAEELGFYEDAGLNVEVVDVRASTDAVAGIIGGSLDIAVVAPDAWIPTIKGESDLIGIASTNRAPVWDVVSEQGISGWKDFAGKRVALPSESGISTVAFALGLRDVGLDLSDVEPVYAGGTSDRFAALQAGSAEVATLGVPVSYVAEDEGYRNHGKAAGEVVEMTSVNIVASRAWLESDEGGEIATRWLRAMLDVTEWAQQEENFDQLGKVTAKLMEIPEEHARRGWQDVFDNEILSRNLEYERQGVVNVLEVLVDAGVLDQMPEDPAALYDHTWLDRARTR